MKLSALTAGTPLTALVPGDVEISSIVTDSRAVTPGALFFARQGWFIDAHQFIPGALEAGAAAMVVTRTDAAPEGVPSYYSEAEDRDLGLLCDRFYASPTASLRVFGITGTNGKTSVSYLLEHMLRAIGERPAVIGTVSHRFEGRVIPARNTTPDGLTIHGFAREAIAMGATCLVLEVSSHGAELGRIAGVAFDVVGFTNLTVDHLDYHETFDRYRAAKQLLFGHYLAASAERGKNTAAVAFEGGDGEGRAMLSAAAAGTASTLVSRSEDADVQLLDERALGADGASFVVRIGDRTVSVESTLIGAHNRENVIVALAMLGQVFPERVADAARSVASFRGIPGRFERAFTDTDVPAVFIDYAHTPDAVARAADVIAGLDARSATIVIGCGGDRDRSKRPTMAEAAASRVSRVILTNDNPRSEDPDAILDEMVAGVGGRSNVERKANRSDAIGAAVTQAGGPVLIAGKGHERYQEIAGVRYHFDDVEESRRAVRARREQRDIADVPIVSGWTVARIAHAVGGSVVRDAGTVLRDVCTDTRALEVGDIFFALRGDRFDGHAFVANAVSAGAALVVVEDLNDGSADAPSVVQVEDTTVALQRLGAAILAEARRRRGGVRTLAITGSNGKTTCKEMAAALLGADALATAGNFNNHIGLPLTLVRLAPRHRFAVLEMGANQPNDIAELVAIAAPDVGLVSSIALAHAEGFGDLDGVRRAKAGIAAAGLETLVLPLVERTESAWSTAIENADDVVTFGGEGATMSVTRTSTWGPLSLRGGAVPLAVPGLHNAQNLAGTLLAVEALTGRTMNAEQVSAALESLRLPGGRLRRVEVAGRLIIDDAYNANPASMKASLDVLAATDADGARIAVLGEMLELGGEADALHREVADYATYQCDILVTIGANGRRYGAEHHFDNPEDVAAYVAASAPAGSAILLKGSRGARVEAVIPFLRTAWEG